MAPTGILPLDAVQPNPAPPCAGTQGCVVELLRRDGRASHEAQTGRWIGERVAQVLGYRYEGVHPQACTDGEPRYFIPDSTLLLEEANGFGITQPAQLLGGVVPHRFVATKSITHPLVENAHHVPDGWAHALGDTLSEITLPGFTAFDRSDAERAGLRLLEQGFTVRIKPGSGIGGLGQAVAGGRKALIEALSHLDEAGVRQAGVVLELNLKPVKTYSVGQLDVGPHRIAYFGMQRLTRNHHDQAVYGGSTLACIRGGMADLMAIASDEAERRVLQCAIAYDDAVSRAYPAFFASRRNYDVALGVDPSGMPRTGVLEQSWRIGGATPAEVLALQALHGDDRLQRVNASTHEVYGLVDAPMGALVSFQGNDPRAGEMTKYAMLDAREDGRGR